MKKVTSVFMAFVLLLALTACNSGGGSGGAKAEIKGETKEVGDFSVLVPEGWMGYDMELSGEPITYKTQIYKGAKEEIDMWSTPSVQITYWKDGEEDILTSAKSAYNDTKEHGSGHHWRLHLEGLTASSLINLSPSCTPTKSAPLAWPYSPRWTAKPSPWRTLTSRPSSTA